MNTFAKLSALVLVSAMLSGLASAQDEAPLSRAQVMAELNAARASGELDAIGAEDSGSFWLSHQAGRSAMTRAQVLADLAACGKVCDTMYGEDSGALHMGQQPITSQRSRAEVVAEVLQELRLLYAGPNVATKAEVPAAQPGRSG